MRVVNLRIEENGNSVRSLGTIIWEDCPRPAQELYFETLREFANGLSCNPHAFLVACSMPAMLFGEKRLFIGGEICPQLRDGIETAMNWMRSWWHEPKTRLPQIEARIRSTPPRPPTPARAGIFFSGGIDSLSILQSNRQRYPSDHPGWIKDGLSVCGLEIQEPGAFEIVLDSLALLAADAGIALIPIHTNIRSLGPEDVLDFWKFWTRQFMGCAFAAIAHAFSKRLTEMTISSDSAVPNLPPYGSHPLIDPSYSSNDLRIHHAGTTLSRFERTKLVAASQLALKHLRVCNKSQDYQPGMLNCGQCEKCLRTMLALSAIGMLDKCQAFPTRTVSVEFVMRTLSLNSEIITFYQELIEPLSASGRHDLARAIELKIADYDKSQKKLKWKKRLVASIKKIDEDNLGGVLLKTKRFFSGRDIWKNSKMVKTATTADPPAAIETEAGLAERFKPTPIHAMVKDGRTFIGRGTHSS